MRTQCPICRDASPGRDANPTYPFCSERCRLIDLGRWLGEEYRMPAPDDEPAPVTDTAGEGR